MTITRPGDDYQKIMADERTAWFKIEGEKEPGPRRMLVLFEMPEEKTLGLAEFEYHAHWDSDAQAVILADEEAAVSGLSIRSSVGSDAGREWLERGAVPVTSHGPLPDPIFIQCHDRAYRREQTSGAALYG